MSATALFLLTLREKFLDQHLPLTTVIISMVYRGGQSPQSCAVLSMGFLKTRSTGRRFIVHGPVRAAARNYQGCAISLPVQSGRCPVVTC